ncbi:MAG: beta-N-acetylhexosaminidase [Methylococcaceae bacterium]|nr:beta-N-acetylhexosaminidase [Methylococcaceae bacterium]
MASISLLGPVMFDLRGHTLNGEEKELLLHPATGGVILFTRNYEAPEQITGLIASLRALRPALLISVDHEGGRVQRFRPGFTRLPPAARYAQCLAQGELLPTLEIAGWLMAAELRSVGVDFSFAPVLDVDCGISEIIGDRSFSRDPVQVGAYALAFAQGMRRAGMAAVGKHFPGHGAVALDSHLTLPEDPRSYAEIAGKDLLSFKTLIAENLEGVMPAHVVYRAMDDKPAGFSRRWIEDVLRGELGFNGAVFSDDLSMEGAAFAGGYDERAHLAIEAGCDMVLVCNQPDATGWVLEALEKLNWKARQARLTAMRGRFPTDRSALLKSAQWREAAETLNRLNEQVAA